MRHAIFCNVVDNYGDAGVCLRLGRELCHLGDEVVLYCNHLPTLRKIAGSEDERLLNFSPWDEKSALNFAPCEVTIAAFSCRLNADLLKEVEKNSKIIINLEYLSAESFVDDFHGLPSPLYKIPCFFFFPGFSEKSGGLNFEQSFENKLKSCPPRSVDEKSELNLSLFSYINPSLKPLLEELISREPGSTLQVFEGLPLDNLNALTGLKLKIGENAVIGSLAISALEMRSQDGYDDLLLASDINLVRGEDSISRAILSGRPFLWQIYPQEENAHLVKLNSFLDCLAKNARHDEQYDLTLYRQIMLSYNGAASYPQVPILPVLLRLKRLFARFAEGLLSHGSLASNLHKFCTEKLSGMPGSADLRS